MHSPKVVFKPLADVGGRLVLVAGRQSPAPTGVPLDGATVERLVALVAPENPELRAWLRAALGRSLRSPGHFQLLGNAVPAWNLGQVVASALTVRSRPTAADLAFLLERGQTITSRAFPVVLPVEVPLEGRGQGCLALAQSGEERAPRVCVYDATGGWPVLNDHELNTGSVLTLAN